MPSPEVRARVILPHTWDALHAEFAPRDYPGDYLYRKIARMMQCTLAIARAEMEAAARRADAERAARIVLAVEVCTASGLERQALARRAWPDIVLGIHKCQTSARAA